MFIEKVHNGIPGSRGRRTFWLFIFTLNRAKKWFNSKLNRKYLFNKLFIQIGKKITDRENSEKQAKGAKQ